jgi:hypothetical protein
MILKDRLYNSLGAQGTQCPFQKINVLPAGAPQPQQRATQAQRQTGQGGTHQTQAKGSFGTVTTPSSSYNNPMNYTTLYSQMNGATSQPSFYNPNANVAPKTPPSSTGAMSKGIYCCSSMTNALSVILHKEIYGSFKYYFQIPS